VAGFAGRRLWAVRSRPEDRGILYLQSRAGRLSAALGCWLLALPFDCALCSLFALLLRCEGEEAANCVEKMARKLLQLQPLTDYTVFSV
jgi:hypothetical protein